MTRATASISIFLVTFCIWMEVSATPILVVRRELEVQPRHTISWRDLQDFIADEQDARDQIIFVEDDEEIVPQRLERLRRNIPNNYHDDFSVDEFPMIQEASSHRRRNRRAQPILDNTDEFSADPFEMPSETILVVPENSKVIVVYPKRDV